MDELVASLKQLSEDSRLSRVFSSSDPCTLTLWLLLAKRKRQPVEYELLYGWVIPSYVKKTKKWSVCSLFKDKRFGCDSKFSMYRLSLQHSGQTIFNLSQSLCMGATLQESCYQAEIEQPNQHKQFSLTNSYQDVSKLLIVRPVVFLKRDINDPSKSNILRPLSSPNEIASAFLGSLVRLNKTEIFNRFQSCQSNRLAMDCLESLKKETGLDFCSSDSKRLGNLEWLCFPTTDQYERSKVDISYEHSSLSLAVRVGKDNFLPDTVIIIRCRFLNGCEVCLDRVQSFAVKESDLCAIFESQQAVTRFLVTIWIQDERSNEGEIWYEHSSSILRGIEMDVGVAGKKGNLSSQWLKNLPRAFDTQIKHAQAIQQIHHDQRRMIKRQEKSPWLTEEEPIHTLVTRSSTSSHKSIFIRNGWNSDKQEEPGILTFFKWLKRITSDSDAEEVWIIDPYFDEEGITEMIARTTAVQATYTVVTNTQANSEYSEGDNGEILPARALRIKKACQDVCINILLKDIEFKILDLRSNTKNKKQIFHDRYVFIKKNKEAIEGYHLSNSIQGATKSHPLLITEIPYSVSLEINHYIHKELLETSAERNYKVIELFSSFQNTTTTSEKVPTERVSVERSKLLFSELLQDQLILSIGTKELGTYIGKRDYVRADGILFEFKEITALQTKNHLRQFSQNLVEFAPEKFLEVWLGLCDWLNMIHDGHQYMHEVVEMGAAPLHDRLAHLLCVFATSQSLCLGLKQETYLKAQKLTELMSMGFSPAITECQRLFILQDQEIVSPSPFKNGIRYAARVLADSAPEKLINELAKLHLSLCQAQEEDTRRIWSLRLTLSFILQEIIDIVVNIHTLEPVESNSLVKSMLTSRIATVRAIAAYAVVCDFSSGTRLEKVFLELSELPSLEYLHTLSLWVSRLRNRRTGQDNTDKDSKQHRLEIFSQMVNQFPRSLSEKDFYSVIDRMSGQSKGSDSVSITNSFLIPLLEKSKRSMGQVADYWVSLAVSRLESMINRKVPPVDPPMLDADYEYELIETIAWAIFNSESEQQDKYIHELNNIKDKAQKLLSQSFLRSRNYKVWERASCCLLWLMLLNDTLFRISTVASTESSVRLFPIEESSSDLLRATFEEHSSHVKSWLWEAVSSKTYRKTQK